MKILVTGQKGQVARALAQAFAGAVAEGRFEVEFLARPEFDLAEPDKIRDELAKREFDVIINAAAYTAVDKAEDEPDLAHRINAVAPGVMAEIAASQNAAIIQLSTDYVFDGSGNRPWTEDDPTAPLGVYGHTKLAGETAVRTAAPDHHLILRTAWVYSPFGNNFVKTMLRLATDRDQISVVNDQFGSPTSALDIADGINRVLEVSSSQAQTAKCHGLGSTFHLAGSGQTNWCDFARQVFEESRKCGGPVAEVKGIPTSEYPTKAVRPANSRLDCSRFSAAFDWEAPDWRVSVENAVAVLLPSRKTDVI